MKPAPGTEILSQKTIINSATIIFKNIASHMTAQGYIEKVKQYKNKETFRPSSNSPKMFKYRK